ncbi:MAG: RHS repeat protein, partial [Acidobacteria bacterium]|nr:RHS repeat protein [Acidobacteriota bacterium]
MDPLSKKKWLYLDAAGRVNQVTEDPQVGRLTKATQPESGDTSFVYDGNGNMTSRTDERGVTTTLGYDSINRLTSKSYTDSTPTVTFGWDSTFPSRLNSVGNGVSLTSFGQHDVFDRPKQSTQTTAGYPYSFSYTYKRNGDLATETYPSGRVLTYSRDGAGRWQGVSGTKDGIETSYGSGAQYAAHGGMKQLTVGNGLLETIRHNSRLQTDRVQLGTATVPDQRGKLELFYCASQALT